MSAKSSQLQVRVTEEEKAALKRLAAAADLSVSAYVLAQALPPRHGDLARLLADLAGAGDRQRAVLEALAAYIAKTKPGEFTDALAKASLEPLSPVVRNQVAAMVEQTAHSLGVDPPEWVEGVLPM